MIVADVALEQLEALAREQGWRLLWREQGWEAFGLRLTVLDIMRGSQRIGGGASAHRGDDPGAKASLARTVLGQVEEQRDTAVGERRRRFS